VEILAPTNDCVQLNRADSKIGEPHLNRRLVECTAEREPGSVNIRIFFLVLDSLHPIHIDAY